MTWIGNFWHARIFERSLRHMTYDVSYRLVPELPASAPWRWLLPLSSHIKGVSTLPASGHRDDLFTGWVTGVKLTRSPQKLITMVIKFRWNMNEITFFFFLMFFSLRFPLWLLLWPRLIFWCFACSLSHWFFQEIGVISSSPSLNCHST